MQTDRLYTFNWNYHVTISTMRANHKQESLSDIQANLSDTQANQGTIQANQSSRFHCC